MAIGGQVKDSIISIFNFPAIIEMSTTGGFEFYIQYKGDSNDYALLL
ncbi:MAG: hypothetical protein AB8U25_06305 [Rickettsiales endosymbiont of Dermacentor nuttalli]